MLVRHVRHLRLAEPGEGKHPDLPRDEGPVLVRVEGHEFVVQHAAHAHDAPGHLPHFLVPALEQNRVVDDRRGDARAVHGRVAVHGASHAVELRRRPSRRARVREHGIDRADALGVQPEVLGVALRAKELYAAVREQAHGERVGFQRTAREPLVRDVEKRNQASFLDDVGDGGPLVARRVDARGVVRAAVQHHDASLGRGS